VYYPFLSLTNKKTKDRVRAAFPSGKNILSLFGAGTEQYMEEEEREKLHDYKTNKRHMLENISVPSFSKEETDKLIILKNIIFNITQADGKNLTHIANILSLAKGPYGMINISTYLSLYSHDGFQEDFSWAVAFIVYKANEIFGNDHVFFGEKRFREYKEKINTIIIEQNIILSEKYGKSLRMVTGISNDTLKPPEDVAASPHFFTYEK
jgi:hypothetical protein